MAALLPLLLLLCSNIHAQVIMPAGWRQHLFLLNDTADFCSVSRWTSEGTQLLFNSSAFYYLLGSLDASHSGQYQVQCWAQGRVTLDRNSTLVVCDNQKMRSHETVELNVGETVELSCDGVGPNQSVQWAYWTYGSNEYVLIDDRTPPGHRLQQLQNKSSLQVTADRTTDDIFYFCLEKQQLRCHLLSRFIVAVSVEVIMRRVGESLEQNCSVGSRNQTHGWWMENPVLIQRESLNSTLMFPSLTLDHSGVYICVLDDAVDESYHLLVCPESEPPVVELFIEGDNLTLHCGNWSQTDEVHWLMRTNRTGGRVSYVQTYHRLDNVYLSNSSLVIRNVSLQDSGQVWCVVKRDRLCVFRSETLVKLREPEVAHILLRSVLLSAVMLMMVLCVVGVVGVVGVVVWRGRRREQLPAAVEEMEMSQLSPESDAQEEAPV